MAVNIGNELSAVAFTLRDGDYLAFQRRMRRFTVLGVLQTGYRWIAIPTAFTFITYNSDLIGGSMRNAAIAWLLIALVWIGYCIWSGRAMLLRVSGMSAGAKQPRTVQLTPDGIVVETITTRSQYDWAALYRTDSDAHRLYFYTGPTTALIIRRDAFPTLEVSDAFLQAASRFALIARQMRRGSADERVPAWERQGEETPGQRVRFMLLPEDLYQFYRVVGRWELVRAILAMIVIYCAFVVGTRLLDHLDLLDGIGFEAVYLVGLVGIVVWQMDRARRKKGTLRTQDDQILTVARDGIEQRSRNVYSFTPWAKINEVRETPVSYLFFMAPRHAFVVPKRAFGSAEEARVFLGNAQALRQGALSGTPATEVEQVQSWPPPPRR